MGTESLIVLAVAIAAAAASAGVQVSAANQQAKAADDTAKFNAKIAENDAVAAQQQAVAEAAQVRRKNRLISGQQRAAYGKAGVDLSGLNDVYADTGAQGELEALSVLYAGKRASDFNQSRATSYRFEGKNAVSAGRYAVAGSIIGGVSSTAGAAASSPSFRRAPRSTTPTNIHYSNGQS